MYMDTSIYTGLHGLQKPVDKQGSFLLLSADISEVPVA